LFSAGVGSVVFLLGKTLVKALRPKLSNPGKDGVVPAV